MTIGKDAKEHDCRKLFKIFRLIHSANFTLLRVSFLLLQGPDSRETRKAAKGHDTGKKIRSVNSAKLRMKIDAWSCPMEKMRP